MKKIIGLVLFVFVLSFGVVIVNGDTNKMSLNKKEIELKIGQTEILVVKDENGNSAANVIWNSSDSKIASVDGGIVKGLKSGITYVTAVYKGVSYRCVVKVVGSDSLTEDDNTGSGVGTTGTTSSNTTTVKKTIPVTKIKISKASVKVKKGATGTLKYSLAPSNATNKSVKWTSSNTKVVTVDVNGKIKAVGVGSSVIKVTSVSNPNISASCTVVVEENLKGAQLVLYHAERKYKIIENNKNNYVHNADYRANKKKYADYKKTSCCKFVRNVLISAGYHKKNVSMLCHTNGKKNRNKPSNYSSLYTNKVTLLTNKKVSDFQPGDIVMYQKKGSTEGNVAIFSHKKDGKYYYYGAWNTNEIRANSHPNTIEDGYWKGKGGNIMIIRVKG
ncbi:MAG: Ig-like domain-containing protein [Bacilli bacterium]|nr:Ig-like domain-containing protein [Bacilli bacterium]